MGEALAAAEVEVLSKYFPFPLDPVQLSAFRLHAQGKDVVCCLPTGAGKTAVGTFAAWRALLRGRRVFYTTPLKALSGQKRREFARIFGAEAVGLVTGEHCIIPDAPIVVMTTEILRNALCPAGPGPPGAGGTRSKLGAHDPLLGSLGSVVLDEMHWISDAARGTAWEEVVLFCPAHVQLLGLSASVGGDPSIFCEWVSEARGRPGSCQLLSSTERPVPLDFYALGSERLLRLQDQRMVASVPAEVQFPPQNRQRVNDLLRLSRRLQRLDWLPAIVFVLSRRGCDASAAAFSRVMQLPRWKPLLSEGERASLFRCLEAFEAEHPEVKITGAARESFLEGVTAHHAGQLPAQRALVERLFEVGLLKMVFATETLAAGIHMPARGVVLCSVTKSDGSGPRLLNGSELLQMSGRAGRRGLDKQGHVVLSLSPTTAETATWAADTLAAGPEPLQSSFSPSYDMLCSLLQGRTLAELKDVVCRSFGAFLSSRAPCPRDWGDADINSRSDVVSRLSSAAHDLIKIRTELESIGISSMAAEEYFDLYDRNEKQEKLRKQVAGQLFSQFDDDPLDDLLGDEFGTHDDEFELPPPKEALLLESHELHNSPCRDKVLKLARRRRASRRKCFQNVQGPAISGRASADMSWSVFLRYIRVLLDAGFLEEGASNEQITVTSLGSTAASITRGANVLWLGAALLSQAPGGGVAGRFYLAPPELAGLVAAMTSTSASADESDAWTEVAKSSLPDGLRGAVAWLEEERRRLLELQWLHGVHEAMPLDVDALAVALAWASGGAWDEVRALGQQRGLAEGDVFRALRRTIEVLLGLAAALGPSRALHGRISAAAAAAAMDRSPLTDNAALDDGGADLDLGLSAAVEV